MRLCGRLLSQKVLSYEAVSQIHKEKLSPTLVPYYKRPLLIEKGSMQWLWDSEGKKYLDFFGGIVTVSVGHCHPRVNSALKAQLDKLWHTTAIYMTEPVHRYAEKLTATLPGNLKVCYFVNSGSEANDMALLLAKLHTGNHEILSLRNGYHGMTQAVASVTNLTTWKQSVPSALSVHRTMNPDPYQGPWGGSHCRDSPSQTDRSCDCAAGSCSAGAAYAAQVEDVLRTGVPKGGLAAAIVESVQGVGGSVQYPTNFLKAAFESTRAWGGVCISDEVQTGFGRMGSHFWGFETHGVTPDIVTMAKGMGNGFPLAAVVTTPEIAASLGRALHFNTFGGNPMASVVGEAVLDVIAEEGFQANCADVGAHFFAQAELLKDTCELVGDVRGKGLMIGIELVEDRKTRKPLGAERMAAVFEATKDAGLLLGKGGLGGNVIRIKPPMCVTKADVDFALDVLTKSLQG